MFLLVIVPLITGGILQKLLGMVGLRLPAGLMGNRSGFEQISRRGFGEISGGAVGGSGIQDSVNGLMTIAKMFM